MADNRNGYNGFNDEPKVRRLEDIFSGEDSTYDYDSSGNLEKAGSSSVSSGRVRETDSLYSSGGSSSSVRSGRSSATDRNYAESRSSSANRASTANRASSSGRVSSSGRASSGSRSSASERTYSSGRRSSSERPYQERPASTVRSSSQRTSSSGGNRPGKNSFKKRKRKFRKLLLLYISFLIVALIIGSIIFSSYLASFENGQPSHIAETIVKSYQDQQSIVNFVTANADKTGISENIEAVAQTYATNIAGKNISYKENSDFRPDSPSYDIRADGNTVAKVTLSSPGTGAFGSPKWEVSKLNITEFLPDAMSVTIQAPQGSVVTVNSTQLDDSYIISSGLPEILENSVQFLSDPPVFDTYKMSGLLYEPTVTVTSADGKTLDLFKTDTTYIASPGADQEFIDSVEARVYDAIDNYATYFIHMSYSLANYIVYGSDLYSYIFGSDTMDPIATSLYMFEDIESYDFIEKSASNYVKYADDCFTVDVKYALDMRFTDPTYHDDNQKADATWVFVIEPLDGSWCISDTINH